MTDRPRLVVGITGSSAPHFGIALLRALRELGSVETHLVLSAGARTTVRLEAGLDAAEVEALADVVHAPDDLAAPISSGSFPTMGMVVAPCSMKALAGIAHGLADDLLGRAADVALKERRRLVLVPRETPLSLVHLRNMVAVDRGRRRGAAARPRLLPPARDDRRPARAHGRQGPRPVRDRPRPVPALGLTASLGVARPRSSQDLHDWWTAYRAAHPDDVFTIDAELDADQDVTAVCVELDRAGRAPVVWAPRVAGLGVAVLTNVFASRPRIARILGVPDQAADGAGADAALHAAVRAGVAGRVAPRIVADGPVLGCVASGADVDVATVPMLRHFAEDAAPYVTSGVVVAEDPETGVGNLSYHRCMARGRTGLATSLHSRGHLFRALRHAEAAGTTLPVAIVVGGHPLWLLAASAKVPLEVDERDVAGGLFGAPLECVRTPAFGLAVPASADLVIEGVIDPTVRVDEGPFGEYSGYASARSTNNLVEVRTICRRTDAVLLDVVSGHSPDHLNLGRIPREADLVAQLQARFPDVVALRYPPAGTHFHCVVAHPAGRGGRAGPPGAGGPARPRSLREVGRSPSTTTWTCAATTRSSGRWPRASRPTAT